jgi:hypothetical protein
MGEKANHIFDDLRRAGAITSKGNEQYFITKEARDRVMEMQSNQDDEGQAPLSLPPSDYMDRCAVGRRDESRAVYDRFGDVFIIWASNEFERKFKAYADATGQNDPEAYSKHLLETNQLQDAMEFVHSLAFWERKPNRQQIYLLLCAAESFGFIRQFEGQDLPSPPLPFIINEDGRTQAEKAKQRRTRKSGKPVFSRTAGWVKWTLGGLIAAVIALGTVTQNIDHITEFWSKHHNRPTTKP